MTPNSVWGALGRAAPKGGVFASELLPSAARPCRALRHLMGSSHRTLHRAVCAHVCARWRTRAHVSMGTCASMHMCWHACVCMHVRIHICKDVYAHVPACACVCTGACMWLGVHMHACGTCALCVCLWCACRRGGVCMCSHPHVHVTMHTCMGTYMQLCMHTHLCEHVRVGLPAAAPPCPQLLPVGSRGFPGPSGSGSDPLRRAPPGPCPLSCPCRPRRAITEHSHDVADAHHLGPWLKKAGPHPLFSSGKNNIQFLPLFPAGGFALPASRSSPPPHRCAPDEQRV